MNVVAQIGYPTSVCGLNIVDKSCPDITSMSCVCLDISDHVQLSDITYIGICICTYYCVYYNYLCPVTIALYSFSHGTLIQYHNQDLRRR